MKLASLLAFALYIAATPASACLPPMPGEPERRPPTNAERARSIASWSTDIAYGMIISETGDEPRFKIIHVYKGQLKTNQVVRPRLSWGFDPPMCHGMVPPQPAFKGSYGVIAYRDDPELSFVPDDILQELFEARLIRSAREPQAR